LDSTNNPEFVKLVFKIVIDAVQVHLIQIYVILVDWVMYTVNLWLFVLNVSLDALTVYKTEFMNVKNAAMDLSQSLQMELLLHAKHVH